MIFPGGLKDIFLQAQQLKGRVEESKAELEKKVVEASAGGGMVTVRVNGVQQILSIRIDPQAVNPGDVAMLEDLVCSAVNEALRRSQDLIKQELVKYTGGIPIPGFTTG